MATLNRSLYGSKSGRSTMSTPPKPKTTSTGGTGGATMRFEGSNEKVMPMAKPDFGKSGMGIFKSGKPEMMNVGKRSMR